MVDTARATVQAMQRAPIVLLSKFTDASLVTRGQVYSFTLLTLPALLCAVAWLILPRDRKTWILFPIVNLLAADSATSFLSVAEGAVATGYFWILFFLLLFRTREPVSQLLFLILGWLAFHVEEGTVLLMPTLLLACAFRLRLAQTWIERTFLAVTASMVLGIIAFQLRWVIYPRLPGETMRVFHRLIGFEFVYSDGRFNLPLLTGTAALFALFWIMVVQMTQPKLVARSRSRAIALGFATVAVLAAITSVFVEQSFSPTAQFWARYQPVFVSLGLALAGLWFLCYRVPQRLWAQPVALAVVAALCVPQAAADVVATMHWRDYVTELEARLNNSSGLIPSQSVLVTGNPQRDANWKVLFNEWVIPLMSFIYAHNGVVNSMIDPPSEMTFRPVDPRKPETMPQLRGIDFTPYLSALAAQRGRGLQ
jgi:hypothetical protein